MAALMKTKIYLAYTHALPDEWKRFDTSLNHRPQFRKRVSGNKYSRFLPWSKSKNDLRDYQFVTCRCSTSCFIWVQKRSNPYDQIARFKTCLLQVPSWNFCAKSVVWSVVQKERCVIPYWSLRWIFSQMERLGRGAAILQIQNAQMLLVSIGPSYFIKPTAAALRTEDPAELAWNMSDNLHRCIQSEENVRIFI